MMQKKIQAFYISSKITNTIIQSQVINWVKLLNATGYINFTLIFQVPLIDFIKKSEREKYNHVKNSLEAPVKKTPIVRSKWNFLFEKLSLFLYIILNTKTGDKIIIQTRENKHAKLITWLKRYRSISFIYEHRGVGAEEYINNLGYEAIEKVTDINVQNKYIEIINEYKEIFEISDVIVNVSEQMKLYVHDKFKGEFDSKLKVVPGGADQNAFMYLPKTRKYLREQLNIKDSQTVLLYSGSLKQKWHMRNFIFEIIGEFQKDKKDIFFICVTPDLDLAQELAKENKLDMRSVFIGFVSNDKINQYLNIADAGLIFREEMATNRFASPTKIAEYLLAGLPVIISENIGDYSEFVKSNNIGFVVKNSKEQIVDLLGKIKEISREQVSLIGKQYYSKQSLLSRYINIYNELANS